MKVDYLKSLLRNAGDEPDRIQQLRKLIVALAVSGKLGVNKRSHDFPSVSPDALPTRFEETSGFTVLGAVARIEKGRTGIKQAIPGAYPLVVTAAERSPCDHFDFEGPAAIVPLVSSTGHGKASLHRLHYQEGKFALGTILAAIFPLDASLVSARFIFEYLSSFKEELLVSRMIGTANVSLSVGKIAEVPIPLVSLDVQAKVDELMALCDQLEAARTEREATRDRLAAASLARLSAPDPDAFAADARFAINTLSSLTARADQIKQFRQAILSLAVQGKLVIQKSSEGSARSISATSIDGAPFAIPKNWSWDHLGDLAELINGDRSKNYPNRSEYQPHGVAWINTGHIQPDGSLSLSTMHYISRKKFDSLRSGKIQRGDLVYCLRGATFGKTGFVEPFGEGAIASSLMIIRASEHIAPHFVYLVLTSPLGRQQLLRFDNGTAQPNLSASNVGRYLVPLPPLAEQHRIVAKVDELMALCDQLEASLTSADDTRRRLLDALLAEALQPALQVAA